MSQPPLTDTEKKTIIDRLRSRLEAYDLKLGTKRALDAECHFMCGAMTAINVLSPNTDDPEALSPSVPREWILDLMRGKSVLKEWASMNDKPKFLLWRIRKELPDGMFTSCEYTAPFPVDEDHVRTSPAVIEWLGEDRLDEIYHPEAVRVPTVPAKRCTTYHRYFDKPSCPYCEAMKRRSSLLEPAMKSNSTRDYVPARFRGTVMPRTKAQKKAAQSKPLPDAAFAIGDEVSEPAAVTMWRPPINLDDYLKAVGPSFRLYSTPPSRDSWLRFSDKSDPVTFANPEPKPPATPEFIESWTQSPCHISSILDPKKLRHRVNVAAGKLAAVHFDAIAVRGLSGLLFGTVLAYQLNKPICVVRKPNEKSHSHQTVEGPDGVSTYVFVDDFICTGQTAQCLLDGMDERYPGSRCVGFWLYESPRHPSCLFSRLGKYLNYET